MDISAQEEWLVLENEVGICLGLTETEMCEDEGTGTKYFSPLCKEGGSNR